MNNQHSVQNISQYSGYLQLDTYENISHLFKFVNGFVHAGQLQNKQKKVFKKGKYCEWVFGNWKQNNCFFFFNLSFCLIRT